jgi:hypothetical protein
MVIAFQRYNQKIKTAMKHLTLIFSFLIFQIVVNAQENYTGKKNNSFEIQDSIVKNDLNIYPNPLIAKKVTVELANGQMSEIRLINITGKVVLIKRFDFGEKKYPLEIEDAPKGIYLVHVKTIDNKIVVKKLLISGN